MKMCIQCKHIFIEEVRTNFVDKTLVFVCKKRGTIISDIRIAEICPYFEEATSWDFYKRLIPNEWLKFVDYLPRYIENFVQFKGKTNIQRLSLIHI